MHSFPYAESHLSPSLVVPSTITFLASFSFPQIPYLISSCLPPITCLASPCIPPIISLAFPCHPPIAYYLPCLAPLASPVPVSLTVIQASQTNPCKICPVIAPSDLISIKLSFARTKREKQSLEELSTYCPWHFYLGFGARLSVPVVLISGVFDDTFRSMYLGLVQVQQVSNRLFICIVPY